MHVLIDFLFMFLINLIKTTVFETKTNSNKLLRMYMGDKLIFEDKLILDGKLWEQKKNYLRA